MDKPLSRAPREPAADPAAVTFDQIADAITVGWDGSRHTLAEGLTLAFQAAGAAAELTGKKAAVTMRLVIEPIEPGSLWVGAELGAKIPQPRPTTVVVRTRESEDKDQGRLFEIIPQAEAA